MHQQWLLGFAVYLKLSQILTKFYTNACPGSLATEAGVTPAVPDTGELWVMIN
jgi:hypothetical protein